MKPEQLLELDTRLRVETISSTPHPQRVCWAGMHQCYFEDAIVKSAKFTSPDVPESWFGEKLIEHAVQYGHHSVLEHAQITFNFIGFPHSVMQQLTRHRHINFSVQSQRYSGKRFTTPDAYETEDLIYLRPVGKYTDRQGSPYDYTKEWRDSDVSIAMTLADYYAKGLELGKSEEHARGLLVFDFRQNFVMSGNLRAMLHLLHLREKADAQLECQAAMMLMHKQLALWAPEVLEWWDSKGKKGRLAP